MQTRKKYFTEKISFFLYQVIQNKNLIKPQHHLTNIAFIKVVFSLSTLQFSLTLSAEAERSDESHRTWTRKLYELFFCTELWAVVFILIFQDLPFLIIRMIVIIEYGVFNNYLLYFLLIKNYVICLFGIYLIVNVLIDERYYSNRVQTHHFEHNKINIININKDFFFL